MSARFSGGGVTAGGGNDDDGDDDGWHEFEGDVEGPNIELGYAGLGMGLGRGGARNGSSLSLDSDNPYRNEIDSHIYKKFSKWDGFGFVGLSAITLGLGNSLDSMSTLSMFHPFLLVCGLEISSDKVGIQNTLVLIVLTQAAGTVLGFASLFGFPEITFLSIFGSYVVACFIWTIYSVLALLPHFFFTRSYPSNILAPFVLPAAYVMVTNVIIGTFFSTFLSIANSVLDYFPLRQVASVFGTAAITFFVILLGTLLSFVYLDINRRNIRRLLKLNALVWIIISVYCNWEVINNRFYQQNIASTGGLEFTEVVTASCVFGQQFINGTPPYNYLWQTTEDRLAEGDAFVLWSEESAAVFTTEQEKALVSKGQEAVRAAGNQSFLGLTYLLTLVSYPTTIDGVPQAVYHVTNRFTLIAPDGTVAWHYEKAFPVPIVEANTSPGPRVLPMYESETYGMVSGAICFDLDFPDYIRGAGENKVDIFLQPSWTWGDVGTRHFDSDAVRTVENGFTLIRCTSDGESGVVGPNGVIGSREYTGHDPTRPAVFNVQLFPRKDTIFPIVGFLFEYICTAFSVLVMVASCMPMEKVSSVVSRLDFSELEFPTDNENERELVRSLSRDYMSASSSPRH